MFSQKKYLILNRECTSSFWQNHIFKVVFFQLKCEWDCSVDQFQIEICIKLEEYEGSKTEWKKAQIFKRSEDQHLFKNYIYVQHIFTWTASVNGFPDPGDPIVSGRWLHDLDVIHFRLLVWRRNEVQGFCAAARFLTSDQGSHRNNARLKRGQLQRSYLSLT